MNTVLNMFHLWIPTFMVINAVCCNEFYNEGVVSDGMMLKNQFDKEDPHCTHHIHKFYRHMKCEPDMALESKCPISYNCPTLEGRSPDRCYYGGRFYNVGFNLTREVVEFHSPCIQSCQCVRMYEGARFYCSHEAPNPGSCPVDPGCRHYSFMEDFTCCQRGVVSCNQGKRDSVKCVLDGRSYSEGEKFFPYDDITCSQCICASGFNAKPSDRVIKPDDGSKFSPIKSGKKCRFGHLTMEVGDLLSPWAETNAKEVECSCRIPPMASCVRRNFKLSDEYRRGLAREGLDNQS